MDSPAFKKDLTNTSGMENPSFELAENNPEGDGLTHRKPSKFSVDVDPNSNPIITNGEVPVLQKTAKGKGNILARIIVAVRGGIYDIGIKHKTLVRYLFILAIFIGYNTYLGLAIAYTVRNEVPISWCDGLGFLIILTGLVYWSLFYYIVLKGYFGKAINEAVIKPLSKTVSALFDNKWAGPLLGLLILGGIVTFVVIDCWDEPRRLVSAGGLLVFLLILLILSKHPGEVQWRQVFSGLVLQFLFAVLVLRWEGGRVFLECISGKVTTFLAFADEGSSFIYNFAASGDLEVMNSSVPQWANLPYPLHFTVPTTFAFTSLSVIFFFSFVVQLLYHIGAMLWVVRKLGWVLHLLVGTSAAESMNAAANIFLGQTEAPLLIKPFMNNLTKSELHAVMTGGFATIAGTVMAAYISFGVKAESLLSASVMAAPCALALSKLMYPETEVSTTTSKHLKTVEVKTEGNALDAAAKGAVEGVVLVGCILANILAFVSFVAFLNAIIGFFGSLVGMSWLTFQYLLGQIFIPVALCIGVDPSETEQVGELLGLKIVVNEFVAYSRLKEMVEAGELNERSRRLAEYALCGFANFSSIGIQLGGLGALAPQRRPELAKLVWRAMITGATASFVNACVAGTLMSFDSESTETTAASNLIF